MAEFVQYGGSNGGNYASYFSCKLSVWEISYDINSNSSNVGYRLELISGSSGRFSGYTANYTVCLDSQGSPQYVAQGNGTYESQSYNTAQTICEGTTTIYHNSDGSKNIGCWASLDFQSGTYSPGDFSPSGFMDLTTIPRYAEFNGHRINTTYLTSAEIAYNSNKSLVAAESSLDGGSWQPLSVKSGTWHSANNTVIYVISNLQPNTSHTIRTRIAHVSGLWTYSNTLTFTTKDIARISSLLDFEHGNDISVIITNPANMSGLSLVMKIGDTQILSRTVKTGTNTIIFSDTELDNLYKEYESSSNLTATFVLTGSGYTNSKTCIVTLRGNQKTIKIKSDSAWKRGKIYFKNNEDWERAVIWKKIDGVWRRGI